MKKNENSKYIKDIVESEEFLKSAEKWENRELGAEEQFARRAPQELQDQINKSLGFQKR